MTLTLPATFRDRSFPWRITALIIVASIGFYAAVDFVANGGLSGSARSARSGEMFGAAYGRVAPGAGFCLFLLAIALLLPCDPKMARLRDVLMAAGLTFAGVGLLGYAFGIEDLYRLFPLSTMALPATICLVLLFVSALLARPGNGWIKILLAGDSGGVAARRLLPAILILPTAFAGLMIAADREGAVEAALGFALIAGATTIGLAAAIMMLAGSLSRRDAQQRRSQKLIDAVIENSPALIFIKDLAGRYLLVNQRYAETFAVDRDAVIGKTDHELFEKPVADAVRAMDERVATAAKALIGEETAPQGPELRTYLSIKSPLWDESGDPYAIFGISTDITDQRRTEAALQASERRNRLVIESALDAMMTIDGSGLITGWNPQAERIFGWTEGEIVGRPVDEMIMPARFRDAHRQGLARYLATGEARVLNRRLELTALRRSGEEFPIELTIAPLRLNDDLSFSAFVRDITDQKVAAKRLEAQLDRLHLFEQLNRAVAQKEDVQSIFEVAVRTLEDRMPAHFVCICRYDRVEHQLDVAEVGKDSLILARAQEIIENGVVQIDPDCLTRALAGGLVHEPDISALDYQFPQRLIGAGLRSLVMSPLVIENEIFGLLIVARKEPDAFLSSDCEFLRQLGEHIALAAHQAQLRSRLQQAYDDLKQSQETTLKQERLRAIGQMASGIAHDINNSISPIGLYTQSILERRPDAPQEIRDYLELVQRVVRDVAATVGRMRDFYRGDYEAETEPINLNELVTHVVELTKARWSDMAQRRGVVINVAEELEADLPLVMGDATELREAMTNLIFNAVDAMPEGGTLTIRTYGTNSDAAGQQRVRIEVGDTGAGMDAETKSRCLDPFFTTKGERGTGLGLPMVQGAAQRHGAILDIDSAPGSGTRICLDFAATPRAQKAHRPVVRRDARSLHLLLIDDDPAVLASTALVLKIRGHDVVAADGGREGLEALRAAHDSGSLFDAVITDLGMPHVDGKQVASLAKELFPEMPVILLTGWGRRMEVGDDAPAHVDFMLPKPLELEELGQVFAQIS